MAGVFRRGAPVAAAASPEVARSRLSVILAGKTHEVLRIVELQRVGKVAIRLLRRREHEEVDLEVTTWLVGIARDKGVSTDDLQAAGTLPVSNRTTVERLARAVRDPDDPSQPLAPVEEWAELDDEILGEAWVAYESLRMELDPLACEITAEELEAIADAGKKKDRNRLFAFGASKLCAFIASTASQPAS